MEALYYEKNEGYGHVIHCLLCPHSCRIPNGKTGLCGVRKNNDGALIAESYGRLTSMAVDPIEKKPLRRFEEGRVILSIGSYGCNFHCSYCQNHEISMGRPYWEHIAPKEVCAKAVELSGMGNIGLAYTYNEPFISYEYMLDCARLIRQAGLKNVVVTNGFISHEPLMKMLPWIDAMNIDLKGYSEDFYQNIGGRLSSVQSTIETAAKHCHVEVTTLIIPGENDSEGEIKRLSQWLASVDDSIPLHITRFFPQHVMKDRGPTPDSTLRALRSYAAKSLRYVY